MLSLEQRARHLLAGRCKLMAADVSVIVNLRMDLGAAEPICRPTNPAASTTFDI